MEAAATEKKDVQVISAKSRRIKTVAVLGAGPVGCTTVMAARAAGATTIIAVDLEDFRLDLAREVGAQTLPLNPIEGLLPEELAAGADYFTISRQNVRNLRLGLECS